MIDVTKKLPIKQEFLDRVLNPSKRVIVGDEGIEDMSLEELERLLTSEGGTGIGRGVVREDRVLLDKLPWWVERGVKGEETVPDFEQGDTAQKIALAPFYLVKYVVKSIERNKSTPQNDMIPFLDTSFKVFGLAGAFSALMMAYDLDFIVKSYNMAYVTGGIAAATLLASTVMKSKDSEDYEISDIEKTYLDVGTDVDDIDYSGEEDYGELIEISVDKEPIKENISDNDYQDEISLQKKRYSRNLPIPQNTVSSETTFKQYTEVLERAFKSTNRETKRRYGSLTNREEIINSLSDYVICNNAGFSESQPIQEDSIVYNNLNYLIYEGLRGVYTNLTYTGEYTMEVKSLVETQLYYKLEVELPKMVKLDKLVRDIVILESKLKSHESDNDVGISVSSYGNTYVFRIKKASNVVVTWGDAIRYYDPITGIKTYEDYMDEKEYVLPILVGLHNEESPVIYDVANNTSIAVAGTSGSGKSWAVYLLLYNMIIQSHPGDVSFIILDFKRDPQYRALARLPHVVGYHHEIEKYMDYIREVVAEMNRRKELLDQLGVSKWEELRANLKDDPEKLHNFPWLFVIVEETAAVLSTLETEGGKESKDEFILLLKQIAKQGRSLGLRIIMISQRTTANELPRDIESECGVKFTFKLKDADLERVEMKPSGVQAPTKRGMAMFKEEYLTEPIIIKSLGIGGMNDAQILNLTRMLAFEWHCRIDDEFNSQNFPLFKITDNRKVRREEVMRDLENEDYFFDISKVDFSEVLDKLGGGSTAKKEVQIVPVKSVGENSKYDTRKDKVVIDTESSNEISISKNIDVDTRKGDINTKAKNSDSKEEEYVELEYVDLDKFIENEYREREKSDEKNEISGSKKESSIKEGENTNNRVRNNSAMMGYRKPIKNTGDKEITKESREKTVNKNSIVKQKSIVVFVEMYGGTTPGGSYTIDKDKLRRYYSDDEIENALSNMDIVESGENDYWA